MSGRRPAFDPARLQDDFDELLPPPDQPRRPASSAVLATATPAGRMPPLSTLPAGAGAQRSARGAGGRPSGSASGAPAASVTAVRIPKPLYDAVIHDLLGASVERPSYAQIIAWTCEDRPAEVEAELVHASQVAARMPRGRRLASEGVPLSLRFKPAERRALDEVIAQAGGAVGKITRTAAVIAALRVAVKHGLGGLSPTQ